MNDKICNYRNCEKSLEGMRSIAQYCCRNHKVYEKDCRKIEREREKKTFKIYKLVYNDEVVYVGQTKQILRLRKKTGYENIPFYKDCVMVIIEETEDVTRERYWINFYRNEGCNLFNRNNGIGYDGKEYYLQNKEKLQEYYKEYVPKYYQANKEKRKIYYNENKDRIIEYSRQYQRKKKAKKEKEESNSKLVTQPHKKITNEN